jgi:hypothetical protein
MKRLWLMGPHRFPLYEFRNLVGDLDKTVAGNARALLRIPEAIQDIVDDLPAIFGKGDFKSTRMREFWERGGFDSGALVQELGDLNFQKLFDKKTVAEIMGLPPESAAKRFYHKLEEIYGGSTRAVDRVREGMTRYANYIEFAYQMEKGGGKPLSFAASRPDHVMALADVRDRAWKLSNELIGAYDSVSVATRWMAKNALPFARWTAVNNSAYARMVLNAATDMKTAIKTGKNLGAKTAKSAYILGRTAIGFAGLGSSMMAYNYLFHRDAEKRLSQYERERPHLILGTNSDGSIRVITGLGAFSDATKWFGLHSALPYTDDLVAGRMKWQEYVKAMASAPVNEAISMIGPHFKMPLELITRKEYWPDAFHPKPMNEPARYLARTLGFEHEFDVVTGRPSRGVVDGLTSAFWKTSEPGEGAYADIQGMKNRFLESLDKSRESYQKNDKGMALYFSRLAKRYGDPEAEKKFRDQYFKLGGTTETMQEALKNLHPLAGLSANDRAKFLRTLDERDRQRLQEAIRYYVEIMLGRGQVQKGGDTLRRADEILKRFEKAGAR